jgi:hypothetical protein
MLICAAKRCHLGRGDCSAQYARSTDIVQPSAVTDSLIFRGKVETRPARKIPDPMGFPVGDSAPLTVTLR